MTPNAAKPRSQRGTHALRKRCPLCHKLRRFYEPPGDQGGERVSRGGWRKVDGQWVCGCASRRMP